MGNNVCALYILYFNMTSSSFLRIICEKSCYRQRDFSILPNHKCIKKRVPIGLSGYTYEYMTKKG